MDVILNCPYKANNCHWHYDPSLLVSVLPCIWYHAKFIERIFEYLQWCPPFALEFNLKGWWENPDISFIHVMSKCRVQTASFRYALCELSFAGLTVRWMLRWMWRGPSMRVWRERDTVFRCSVWGRLSVESDFMTDESAAVGCNSLS